MATSSTTKPRTRRSRTTSPTKPPERKPVTLDGEPAKNRHFVLDRVIYDAASARAKEENYYISDVLRAGIKGYADGAPSESDAKKAVDCIPDEYLPALKDVWTSKNSTRINAYLAEMSRAGWPVRSIANSLMAAGATDKITRQAVSLRVVKGQQTDTPIDDLPPVPALGPRKVMVAPSKAEKRSKSEVHDIAFRVKDSDYAAAVRHAKHEGAQMTAVLEGILFGYANGEFDLAIADDED